MITNKLAIDRDVLTKIGDAVRAADNSEDLIPIPVLARRVAGVYEAGVKNEYDRFWDAYQQNGTKSDYAMAFAGSSWTKETFKPKYMIRPTTGNQYMMFARTGIDVLDETVLDTSQLAVFAMSFYSSNRLREITIDISNLTAFSDAFNYDSALETVALKNVPETCDFTGGFQSCIKLTNFTVTGTIGGSHLNLQWSKQLSHASIKNIIEHLSTTSSAKSVTLSKTAVEAAFTAEEWTVLVNTRSNWTINLV